MRPLAILLGIVLGSSAALAVSLAMTAVIFLLLSPDYPERLLAERTPLLTALAWSALAASLAAAAFVGELKLSHWRRPAQLGMAAVLGLAFWFYWP